MKKGYLLLGIVVFSTSCNYFFRDNKNITLKKYYSDEPTKLFYEGAICDSLECGKWKFYDKDGQVTEEGSFKAGFREGLWKYNLADSAFYLRWIVLRKHNSIEINYPDDWGLIDQPTILLNIAANKQSPDASDQFYISEGELSIPLDSGIKIITNLVYKAWGKGKGKLSMIKFSKRGSILHYDGSILTNGRILHFYIYGITLPDKNLYFTYYNISLPETYAKKLFIAFASSVKYNGKKIIYFYDDILNIKELSFDKEEIFL